MSDPNHLVQQALAAHQQGDLARAEPLYRQALAALPGHPQVSGLLGVLLCQKGPAGQDEGLRLLRGAVAAQPGDPQLRNNLATALQMAGRAAEAAKAFEEVLRLEPKNLGALQSLTALYHQIDRPGQAVTLCRRALADQDDPVLRYNLATSLNLLGELDEAEAELEAVVARAPELEEAWGNLGAIQTRRGKIEAALATFAEARERFAGQVAFPVGQGNAHYRAKAWGPAAEAFAAALAIDPENLEAHSGLIHARLRAEDHEGALAAAERAAALPHADTNLLSALGEAFEAADKPEAALEVYKKALGQNPTEVRAVSRLGPLARLAGEEALAERYFDYRRILYRESVNAPPEGYDSVTDFNRALADYIYKRRDHVENALDTTTRGGSQTAELFNDDAEVVQRLRQMATAAAGRFLEALKAAPPAPYFEQAPEDWRLISNAVVLKSSGYQDPHIHVNGFLSGVYYLKIPPEMKEGETQGCIFFSDSADPKANTRRELVRPEEGTFVFFPSYLWHGTVPFESDEDRICVALDLVPLARAGEARSAVS